MSKGIHEEDNILILEGGRIKTEDKTRYVA